MFILLVKCIPLATAKAILIPEKLPGPVLTRIEKLLSRTVFLFFNKSKISRFNNSYLTLLICRSLIKKLFSFNKAMESFFPVQLMIKKFLLILLIIFIITPIDHLSANVKDKGVIVLMYHRFDENRYPSTNIKMSDFIKQLDLIKKNNFKFISAEQFEDSLKNDQESKKLLITIDDAFSSFYENAWPLLKKEQIPFILFVNTREVGSRGYMNWDQLKEISKEPFVHIGNHGYSHDYLVDKSDQEIIDDIKLANKDFEGNLKPSSTFFSYPFGEYSLNFKKIVKDFGFKFAFGQHSGVADETKDIYEIPRFPINETYGEVKRFETILKTIPFKFKSITPSDNYIQDNNNPPKVTIDFYEENKNLNLINCYSNELDTWKKSDIEFIDDYKLKINLNGKYTTERGRINCSLREEDGSWRWLGIQFVIANL